MMIGLSQNFFGGNVERNGGLGFRMWVEFGLGVQTRGTPPIPLFQTYRYQFRSEGKPRAVSRCPWPSSASVRLLDVSENHSARDWQIPSSTPYWYTHITHSVEIQRVAPCKLLGWSCPDPASGRIEDRCSTFDPEGV